VPRFSRPELERAFQSYQERGRQAGASGDWNPWADQFTDDAVYVEHHYGRMEGQPAIREWITATMSQFPNDQFTSFPVEWAIFDDDRGWIVCEIQNRLADPGDGSVFQAANLTRLVYAGDDRWSYEEDAYNPKAMADVLQAWSHHRRTLRAE
jgi:hypothetical protein